MDKRIVSIVKMVLGIIIIPVGLFYGALFLFGVSWVDGQTQKIIMVIISIMFIFGGPIAGFKLIKSSKNK